ncbi:phosphotransferase [Solirubrobacter sp. CPCC 204708]|uniref:Maltokinase n=1 Tax=Solirubrobacter deserti TaxID=2282478 RepID=A0ABT4RRW1_9ACTN|nr:phosphotransferase [Solirubrobacter deserti]MBE2317577.1 phosphotransferase [Solirubrobacter deserti]MDA0141271.1 phosphotransferase [Solirubrobacter deserti]
MTSDLTFIDEQVLNDWVVAQRWFASKTREVSGVEVVDSVALSEQLVLALIEARFPVGTHETYQVPLALRPSGDGEPIFEKGGQAVYDALADPETGRELLRAMAANRDAGDFAFRWTADHAPDDSFHVRPVGVEQSNTSIVFGDQLIMKAIRRIEPGVNPELELLRFLSAREFPHIAALHGWYEVDGRHVSATLGILQEFLAGAKDGWEMTLDELASDPDGLLGKIEALGVVIGELHSALGSDNSDPDFAPVEPSAESLSILYADVDEQIERVFLDLPDSEATAPIAGRGQDVREKLSLLAHATVGGRVIRTHGDLHLGQTMYSAQGWKVLDFEGEPARPLPERRLKRSPLRDVAGMLRSFSYATAGSHLLRGREAPADWEERARERFLAGYHRAVDNSLLPPGQQATEQLLAVFELEKAVYELRYELNNRPDWVAIPVAGIVRLLETE